MALFQRRRYKSLPEQLYFPAQYNRSSFLSSILIDMRDRRHGIFLFFSAVQTPAQATSACAGNFIRSSLLLLNIEVYAALDETAGFLDASVTGKIACGFLGNDAQDALVVV